MVCTRWKYLINRSDKIWRGNIKLKGLTEQMCKNKLCEVLKGTPKLKYLQIGENGQSQVHRHIEKTPKIEDSCEITERILQTIFIYNRELEYLHVIDRYPLNYLSRSVLLGSKLKRLKITLNKLCNRRRKIDDLKKIFGYIPDIDNLCIEFCQRIHFICEKKTWGWKIHHDFESQETDEFM
ncbi:hypothetical protein RUM44_000778 [Polyplax serrata]|uniref:F-box domain-containing protein n=1 Tax=Polyplax serrata TaxID=468196 RepID=A0ABR1B8K5_POLSC